MTVINAGRRMRGFTLSELLISMLLGVFLIGGVLSVFLGSLQTFGVADAMSRMQESGRFALEVLRRDIRQAGYFGCGSLSLQPEIPRGQGLLPSGLVRSTLASVDGDAGVPAFEFDYLDGLRGFAAVGSGALPMQLAAYPFVATPLAGADVLAISTAGSVGFAVMEHPGGTPPGSAAVRIASGSDIQAGDILMVTNCEVAAIFQASAFDGSTGRIAHDVGGAQLPGNYTSALGREFAADGAEVYRLERAVYYLADDPASAQPTLFRDRQPLIEGVERLQFGYGLDVDGDGRVDVVGDEAWLDANQVVAAIAVDPWAAVLAVRVQLLLSAPSGDAAAGPPSVWFDGRRLGADDGLIPGRLYQAFTATVGIRNRLR